MCHAIGTDNGFYKGYEAYTDYISRTNLVLFVKSAGNLGDTTGNITSPGLGLNVLTVGATDANKNIYYKSSYGEENTFLKKPTFVAPGEKIIIPNIEGYFSGTSLSAPMVTGIAALLLEEFDFLVNYPDLLAAALINGCEQLPGQTEMWNKYAGYGMINYVNTRSIILEQRYTTAITTQTQSTALFETSTYLNSGKDLTYCFFAFSRQNITDYNFQDFTIGDFNTAITPAITLYKVQIFDPNGNLIHTGESDNNVIVGRILNTTQSGNYCIRIYMSGTKQGVSSEYLSLVYSSDVHEHSYTHRYSNPKTFGHTCYCVCGGSMFEPHVFQEIFGESRTCAKCGYIE